MPENVPAANTRRRYRSTRSVAEAAYPGLTQGSAHQKEMRVEQAYLDLVRAAARAGRRDKIAQLRARVLTAEAEIDATQLCVMTELQDVHRANLAGDAARFSFALDRATTGNLEALLRTTYREIGELKDLAVALEAQKAAS